MKKISPQLRKDCYLGEEGLTRAPLAKKQNKKNFVTVSQLFFTQFKNLSYGLRRVSKVVCAQGSGKIMSCDTSMESIVL